MKNKLFKTAILLICILIYECKSGEGPYYMYTHINTDGSCYREFIRTADSAFVAGDTSKNPFPFKLDSNWKVTFYKRLPGDTSFFSKMPVGSVYKDEKDSSYSWFATARKEFKSVSDMAEQLRYSEWDSLQTKIDLKKKFRWFYTYYEYNEVYKPVNVLKLVPVSDYLTNAEIATLYGESKDLYQGKNGLEIKSLLDDLQKKTDEWFNRSIYEEIYRLYIKHYDRFQNPPVDAQAFALEKDTIYKYYGKSDTLLKGDFSQILDHHFHTNAYSDASNDEFDKLMESEFPDFLSVSEIAFNYKLSLPGKIIETNAPFMNQDTLSWKIDSDRFYFSDYTVKASSRKPNYWAFAVTSVVIIIALFGLFVKRKE
jgi:hypothetical protein